MPARRSPLATWLAVLAGLALALGISGLWAQRTVGDPATFAALAVRILEQASIRTQLAVVIVDPVLEDASPDVQAQRQIIVTTTESVLGDPRFVTVFEGVLRRAATQLADGSGPVRLDLTRPLDRVVTEVRPISPDLADRLAAIDPPAPEVVSPTLADALRSVIGFERAVSVALLLVGGVLAVVAGVRGGPRALLPLGATLAGACLVLFGTLLVGRSLLLAEIHPAGRAEAAADAWNVVVADLRTALLVATVVGGVAVVAGGVLGRRT